MAKFMGENYVLRVVRSPPGGTINTTLRGDYLIGVFPTRFCLDSLRWFTLTTSLMCWNFVYLLLLGLLESSQVSSILWVAANRGTIIMMTEQEVTQVVIFLFFTLSSR